MYFDGLDDKKFVDNSMLCQFGGGDQWGNITTGLEFIRKICSERGIKNNACCFGVKLYLKPDGTKFGKTASGAVWLDEKMTNNYAFYQYLINQPDNALESLLKRFTFLSSEAISSILEQHKKEPFKRIGQKKLAEEVTRDIRGQKGLDEAIRITEALFSGDITKLSEKELLSALRDSEYKTTCDKKEIPLIDALVNSKVASSKSEGRKLIEQGAISVEGKQIKDVNFVLSKKKFYWIKKGKRDYVLVEFI